MPLATANAPHGYRLRFEPLLGAGMAMTFPCDVRGTVPLDELDDRSRTDYLFARAMVGRTLGRPTVEPFPPWDGPPTSWPALPENMDGTARPG